MGEMSHAGIARRDFLKGAALMGAVASVGTMAGCSSPTQSGSSASSSDKATVSSHSWENAPEPITDIAETQDYDVVIVGAGIAGMTAFMYAAQAGARVALLEKGDSYHGRGLDFAAVGSKVQKRNGISIDKGKLINDLVKSSGYKANGSLLRLWADYSGDVFDTLIDMTEADGVEVTMGVGSMASANAEDFATRTYPTDHEFGGVVVQSTLDLIGRMETAGKEAGGEVFYSSPAVQLITENDGTVAGAIAETDNGYVQFNAANGVILATGDYGSNEDMVAQWCPLVQKVESTTYPTPDMNTGDGINMACWVGGTVQQGAHAAMIHPIFGGGALCASSLLKVNNSGKRFCNENTTLPGISNMYLTSAENKVWTIFDSDYASQMDAGSALSNYNNNTAGPLTQMFMSGEASALNPPSHAEVVDYCIKNGTTVKADTLSELASAIGVDPEALSATVERYNEMVDAGVDSDFGKNVEDLNAVKQAPFYASVLTAKLLVIASGLDVDSCMRVLKEDGEPVGGLYAVGNVMGNFFANDYPICAPGLSHGRCLTLGALVGDAVATKTEIGANFTISE